MSTTTRTRTRTTYPKWIGPSQAPSPIVPPREIPPLLPPSSSSCPNPLPYRPPPPAPPDGWTHKLHIIPAAYPRSFVESTGKYERSSNPYSATETKEGESKEERKKRNLEEARVCIQRRFDATHQIQATEDEGQLWLAGECWARTKKEGEEEGLTMVVSAANGFTKESWMPTIGRLVDPSSSPTSEPFGDTPLPPILRTDRIDEIWFLDNAFHGQSIDLNKGQLGSVHSWLDGGRDILNFVRHVLPPSSNPSGEREETLPWHSEIGRRRRKVIGIGHSVGGNAMVRAAHMAPELFHALFLVEPMVPPIHHKVEMLNDPEWPNSFFRPVVTIRRRASWASMQEALQVRSSPFFSGWHDEVFKIWETHHLVPSPHPSSSSSSSTPGEGGVTLATPSWAEAAVFTEPTGLGEGWDALPTLQVPVGFLMAGDASSTLGEEMTRELVWRPPMASNERLMDAGHLIVHEQPAEVADAIRRFLGSLVDRPDTPQKARL